jgi:hypothetical protein
LPSPAFNSFNEGGNSLLVVGDMLGGGRWEKMAGVHFI